jgi:hypothetical protein
LVHQAIQVFVEEPSTGGLDIKSGGERERLVSGLRREKANIYVRAHLE